MAQIHDGHLTTEQLSASFDKQLSSQEQAVFDAHISTCQQCQNKLSDLRLTAALRMCEDGLSDLSAILHARGKLLDVWTLNAGTAGWRDRLQAAVALQADVITTETPHALVEAVLKSR